MVTAVTRGSPADRFGIQIGDELVSLNGTEPSDVIEFQRICDADEVDILVRHSGQELAKLVRVRKGPGEPLGVEVSSAVFDRIRTCDNHCAFCFIYQLPKGMRRSLYVKDDDYRLSFLYGNFTTLTRFTELDAERVLEERLGPLFVSIHATDPETRASMLRNPRGATSLRWLRVLLEGDIEVHGQIVVCPGINNGEIFEDTLATVLDEYPKLSSLGVVPLGLSRFSKEPEMRVHTPLEAAEVCDAVARWQEIYLSILGRRLVYVGDEYYLLANRNFPELSAYDDFPQHENGIGMAKAFENAFTTAVASSDLEGVRHGFFASLECAPAEGYRSPALDAGFTQGLDDPSSLDGFSTCVKEDLRPVTILTGTYGARILAPLVSGYSPNDTVVESIENDFFGGNISVAGLLTGQDVSRHLSGKSDDRRYLLPDACLSNGKFLDGMMLSELPLEVEVLPTEGSALRHALDGVSFRRNMRSLDVCKT